MTCLKMTSNSLSFSLNIACISIIQVQFFIFELLLNLTLRFLMSFKWSVVTSILSSFGWHFRLMLVLRLFHLDTFKICIFRRYVYNFSMLQFLCCCAKVIGLRMELRSRCLILVGQLGFGLLFASTCPRVLWPGSKMNVFLHRRYWFFNFWVVLGRKVRLNMLIVIYKVWFWWLVLIWLALLIRKSSTIIFKDNPIFLNIRLPLWPLSPINLLDILAAILLAHLLQWQSLNIISCLLIIWLVWRTQTAIFRFLRFVCFESMIWS